MEFTHYQVLGVSESASQEEIKSSYKNLAKKFHPDKNPGNSAFEEHFKKINSAYQILSNPDKRKNYDIKLYYQRNRPVTTSQTSTRTQKPNPSQKKRYNREAERKRKAEEKKFERKVWKYTIIGGLLFLICCTIFYEVMNTLTYSSYFEEAMKLEQKGQPGPAIARYTDALIVKEEGEAFARRGLLRYKRNDFFGALDDLNLAIKKGQSNFELFYTRGKANIRLRNYNDASSDFEDAVKIKKSDSAYFYLAEIQNFHMKNYSKALAAYNEVIQMNPAWTDAIFGKGLCLQSLHFDKEAIEAFEIAITRKPNEGEYYYYNGFSKLNLKDSISACQNFQIAKSFNFYDANDAVEAVCY